MQQEASNKFAEIDATLASIMEGLNKLQTAMTMEVEKTEATKVESDTTTMTVNTLHTDVDKISRATPRSRTMTCALART